ncbi:hypothetical protein Syun_001216 [Stephania yunnanensis]|uniref:DNA-directed RNA polymerase n=1 Tax=Stephania yunnanensis TaxID=152371 RepID=A0AAP0QAN9_9MAGN
MSSNMQRQAVQVSQSGKCIVRTRLEHQTALDSRVFAIVEHEGNIIYTDTGKIVLLGNGDTAKLMIFDINELHRRVIYRNNTLTDLLTTSRPTPGELVMCQEKFVQEVVDTLLDYGIHE